MLSAGGYYVIREDSEMRVVEAVVSLLIISIISLVGFQIIGAIPLAQGQFSDTSELLQDSITSTLVLAVGGLGFVALIIGSFRGMS